MPLSNQPSKPAGFNGPAHMPGGVVDNGIRTTFGRDQVIGAATIPTGLPSVTGAIASLETIGVAPGDPFVVQAKPSATPGSIDVTVKQDDGTNATAAVFVDWAAFQAGVWP